MLLDSDINRIRHMIEASEEALEYARNRRLSDVETDPALRHLLVRDLEILGEAASRVSSSLQAAHPEIPWRTMVNTRNRLIHAYFEIDMDIVWSTVQEALPQILSQLQTILKDENNA